ncbi:hypothetical protein ACFC09_17665 [Streptomyces sp. NPDC056161]|uniref:hypothetical protein n=1 Tax=Streptomyces sp. NPDC056161 TaxID=3345732 RepID=UPI0035DBD30F
MGPDDNCTDVDVGADDLPEPEHVRVLAADIPRRARLLPRRRGSGCAPSPYARLARPRSPSPRAAHAEPS